MPSAHSTRRQARKAAAASIIEYGWALRRISGLEILTAKIFGSIPWLVHGFSTRKGGASRLNGAVALNLGFTDWDSREAVTQNRITFVRAMAASKSGPKIGREKSL